MAVSSVAVPASSRQYMRNRIVAQHSMITAKLDNAVDTSSEQGKKPKDVEE